MKINFKQPKFIIPLLAAPFIVLCFYLYQINTSAQKARSSAPKSAINSSLADVSQDVKSKSIADKLEASRQANKRAPGATAINPIAGDEPGPEQPERAFSPKNASILDSIDLWTQKKNKGLQSRIPPNHLSFGAPRRQDEVLGSPVPPGSSGARNTSPSESGQKDPMDIFRQQMAYIDSVAKAADPQSKAEKKRQQALAGARALLESSKPFLVTKVPAQSSGAFNTIMPAVQSSFISCMIDEEVTVYSGSRVRLKLLEDIAASGKTINKGEYLYAVVSGFSSQRVQANVTSILAGGQILPVKLTVYDLDGIAGLYVPDSKFRDFSKDLGGNTLQGVSIEGNNSDSQFLMSTMDKVFQSTSSAIASAIRKNKARLKYNSFIYLKDPQAQESAQKNN